KPAFGAGAWVAATRGAREHLRNAIEQHSAAVRKKTVYVHTGWVSRDGGWFYLPAGGVVGAGGNDPSASVELRQALGGCRRPGPRRTPGQGRPGGARPLAARRRRPAQLRDRRRGGARLAPPGGPGAVAVLGPGGGQHGGVQDVDGGADGATLRRRAEPAPCP